VAVSEQGAFFYDTTGALIFEDNTYSATNTANNANRLFTDDGTTDAYPYSNAEIGFSSEVLFNEITVLSSNGINGATASDAASQATYSISHLDIENIFYSNEIRLSNLANLLISRYSVPEYRISSVIVPFRSFSDTLQDNILAFARINSFMKVKFRPNGIGTSIEKYVRVIGIEHNIDLQNHLVRYVFESLRNPSLVLDDVEFGKLDTYSLGL
jgi:hypothetical protein